MTSPEPPNVVSPHRLSRDAAEARIASLRAEIEAASDAHVQSALHHELGVVAECHLKNDAGAVKEYLTAFNLDPTFRPPLFALLRIFERRRAFANLARLYEAEARSAPHVHDRASAIIDRAGLAADREGNGADALALLARALDTDPTSLSAALMLERDARAASDTGMIRGALEARAEHTHDPVLKSLLYTELAWERAGAGDLDGAFELMRTAGSLPRGRYRALEQMERMARLHDRTDNLVPALEGRAMLALAEARGEDRGQASGAFSVKRFADEARAAGEAAALLHEAARLRMNRHGDPAGAAQTLAQAIAIRPDDMLLHQERMLACDLAGQTALAIEEARWLLSNGVTGRFAASIHFRLAEIARAANDVAGAHAALAAAIEADPGSAAAAAMLDDLLLDGSEHAERIARLEARAAREEVPVEGRVQALFRAAQIAAELLGDFARARPLYDRAISLTEDKSPILRELYGAAMRHGAWEAARDALRVLRFLPIDPEEQSVVWFELHSILRNRLGDEHAADAVLEEAIETESCARWAPDLARVQAARAGNVELLARAHEVLADRVTDDAVAGAHLAAAARALIHAGAEDRATELLRKALSRSPGQRYAVSLLEEVLLSRGEAGEAVALLREAAEAQEGARAAEMSLLLAGAAAEATGDAALAATTYEQAADRDPTAISPLLALSRLAERTKNESLLLRSREALSERELAAGEPGRATIELAEHYDFVAKKPELAESPYRAALPSEVWGSAAAVGLALLPGKDVDPIARIEAYQRLAAGASEPVRIGVLRGVLGEALQKNGSKEAAASAAERLTELVPDDVVCAVTRMRLAGGEPDLATKRADAWVSLASAAEDPEAGAELLLAAMRAKIVSQGPDAFDDAFLLAQEIHATAPDAPAAGVALDETLAPGDDPEARVDALSARLLHSGKARPAALEAAVGRALLMAGRTEESVRVLRRMLGHDPTDLASWEALRVAARHEARFEEVVRACDELAKHAEGEFRAMLLEEAAACLMDELGKDAEAEKRLRMCVDVDVTRPIGFGRLHNLLAERGDTEGLIELVNKRIDAIDDPAELAKHYYELARLYRSQGDRDGALAALENLHMLESDHVGGLALQVEVMVSLERWAEAVETLRALAAADVPAAQKRLAHLGASDFLEKRLNDPDGALEELDALVAMGLGDSALYARMAGVAERAGRYERAVAELRRAAHAAGAGPEQAAHHRRAGELLRNHVGELPGSIMEFRRALEAAPTDLTAAEALAHLLVDPVERMQLSQSFEAAVRGELVESATNASTLRKLYRAATFRDDKDLEYRALGALAALGHADSEEAAALATLASSEARAPRASLDAAALAALRAPGADGPPAALARLVWESVTAMDRLEPATFGVGKPELVSPKQSSAQRDALSSWVNAFGSSVVDLYVGGPEPGAVAAMPGKKGPTWIVGTGFAAEPTPAQRFLVGQLATALTEGTLPFVQRRPEDAATLLFAVAAAGEAPLAGGAGRSGLDELTRALARALPRRARKGVPEVVSVVKDGGASFPDYCRAALRTALRGGLVASSDIRVALGAVLGGQFDADAVAASPEARDLLMFWVAEEARVVRRALGLAK